MRRLSFLLLFLAVTTILSAQKFAVVNTDYVLANLPEYAQAQQRIDKYVADWQKEIETKEQELSQLQQNYQQEAYLLPDNLRQRREADIKTKMQEVRELQHKRFGAGGDLENKRAEFLKPIQDRIYSAIETIARSKGYPIVFDKAGSPTVLYADDKCDITALVLENLGSKGSSSDNGSSDAKKTKKKTKKK